MEQKSGYALIVVLWTIVIVGIIFVNLTDEVKLNNLLLENNLEQKKLRQVALDGILDGINQLEADSNLADARSDSWTNSINRSFTDKLGYKVTITDVGSKFNINYMSRKDFMGVNNKFNWKSVDWEKISQKLLSTGQSDSGGRNIKLVSDLADIKEWLGADYQQAQGLLTTYGKFNINLYSRKNFVKLLNFLKDKYSLSLREEEIKQAASKLRTGSSRSGYESTDEFVQQAFSSNAFATRKIKPYLTVKKRLNINFISPRLLAIILGQVQLEPVAGGYQKMANKLVKYCQKNNVTELEQLDNAGVGMISSKIDNYFNTYSTYFLISVTAYNNQENRSYTKEAIVKKIVIDESNWELQIIAWK